MKQHNLEHGEEKRSTRPPEGLKFAGLGMRDNFEFPGSLGKKGRTISHIGCVIWEKQQICVLEEIKLLATVVKSIFSHLI